MTTSKEPLYEIWGGDLGCPSYWDCGPDEHLGDYLTYGEAAKALKDFHERGFAAFIKEKNPEKSS